MNLPQDFDLLDARTQPFSARHATPSRQWVMDQAATIAGLVEGLPCGVAGLVLEEAMRVVSRAAERAATSTVFHLDSHGSPEAQSE